MKCPYCKNTNISTVDTRQVKSRNSVRRKKKCNNCHHRWTTLELSENLVSYYEETVNKYKEEVEVKFLAKKQNVARKWTPSEQKRLISLYYSGMGYPEIANDLNRSYNSVLNKITKMRNTGNL